MNIKILQGEKGAVQATGIAVIIDVFRAFTLEAYLYADGAEDILISPDPAAAFRMKQMDPDAILIGERQGRKCEGFDYGNSPSSLSRADVRGKRIIHTTSNGTRGILKASGAAEIVTGALVNAAAVAAYIRRREYKEVSLVCMGREDHPTEEDTLCAEYIRSLLEGKPLPDAAQRAADLRFSEGSKFFDPLQQDVFPQADFEMCVRIDLFDFVIQCRSENGSIHNRKAAI